VVGKESLLMTSRELASPSEEISLRNAIGLARSGFTESMSSSVAPYACRTAASTAQNQYRYDRDVSSYLPMSA
jgi:hypothetical protein